MLHIVFQEADIQTLQTAIALDEIMQGEVWQIKDEFAVGPIAGIYETEGYQQRRDWWKDLLQYSPYVEQINLVDDKMTVHHIKQKLDEQETVWIWMAQNAHDVCGYYWLMSQLAGYAGNVMILNLGNLPFINDKGGLFYPNNLFEILPKEFLKAKKLARPITPGEYEMDSDEWKRQCTENATVRILEGGKKIVGKESSFYDESIFSMLSKEPQKLNKFLQSFYTKTKVTAGDVFIVWRIRRLAEEHKIMVSGDWNKGWKDISLQMPSYEQATLSL